MFNKKLFFTTLALAQVALFIGCSDSKPNPEPNTPSEIPSEIVYPVDFRYLTFGPGGNSGGPSLSYIKNDGTIIVDHYKDVNGESIGESPNTILQSKENILVAVRNFHGSNKIEIINSNSFTKVKTIDLELAPSSMISLDDDKVLVVGSYKKSSYGDRTYRIDIIDTKSANPKVSSIDLPYKVRTAVKVGDKVALVCKRTMLPSFEFEGTEILFFDADNITLEGMRHIDSKQYSIEHSRASLEVDKNKKIWTIMQTDGGIVKLCCIDPLTEEIIHNVDIPLATTLKTAAIAMSNDGQYVYVRAYEAFYKVNVDDVNGDVFSNDPIFEHSENTGTVSDLKTTKEGTLLFVDKRLEDNTPSRVYEYKENSDGTWTRLVKDGSAVAPHAMYIYVAKH